MPMLSNSRRSALAVLLSITTAAVMSLPLPAAAQEAKKRGDGGRGEAPAFPSRGGLTWRHTLKC